jgi:hypothetical protein
MRLRGLGLASLVPLPKTPYTLAMVRVLGAVLMLVTVTTAARAEECVAPTGAADPAAEERAYSAELERFARLRAFTERLVARREAEAFEQATVRQARMAKLKQELTAREAAMSEREFDEAVALYLKKRQLTLALTQAAAQAKTAPAVPTSTPATPPPTPTTDR